MYQILGRNRGFTLIELLVVVAIIGILSSVVLASLNSARQKGRDTRRLSDIKQLQLALELSYDANAEYPNLLSDLDPTYISIVPTDPNNVAYVYDNVDNSAGGACSVADAGSCSSYTIMGTLEDTNHSALAGAWQTDVVGDVTVSCDGAGEYCVRP